MKQMARYEYGGQHTQMYARLPGYKNIVAWQVASDLGFMISQLVDRFGPAHYKLADQMRRAATSVSGNIAEGYCSGTLANYIRYCNIARGSLGELGSYLQDCERTNLLSGDVLEKIVQQYGQCTFFIDRLLGALAKKEQSGDWRPGVKEQEVTYIAETDYDLEPEIIFPSNISFISPSPLSP